MTVDKVGNFGSQVQQLKADKTEGSPFGKTVSQAAHEKNEARKAGSAETSFEIPEAPADVQQNQAIIEASFGGVSISAGNESLQLTLKATIEKLNEILAPDLGPRAIETAYDSGLDVSPEATADRIVSLSTALFARYQEANPDLEGAELANKFVDVISGGIEQGFAEAREILDGLGVLGGDIAANIDSTYELVQQGLDAFLEANGGTVNTDDNASVITDTL